MDNNYWDRHGNQLIYTTAAVITEKLGYKMNSYKDQYTFHGEGEGQDQDSVKEVSQLSSCRKVW